MPETIGTGLVGFGLAGEVFHAPLITAVAGLELKAVVSSQAEAIARAGYRQAESFEAMLADPAIALVVVATPTATHHALACAALEAGKHVVVEKLFAATSDEAQALIDLAAERGRLLTAYHNRRWDGDFLTVRRLVEEGSLGPLSVYEACWDRHRPVVGTHWKEEAGPAGGVLADLGPHLMDQALLLFGRPASVSAEILRQRQGGRADDFFELHLHYPGFLVRLSASMLAAAPRPRFAVHGREASFVKHGVDPQQGQLKSGMRPGDEGYGAEEENAAGLLTSAAGASRRVLTEDGRYHAFYEQLAAAISGEGEVPVDPRDALDGIRIIEAARESVAQGRRIEIPERP